MSNLVVFGLALALAAIGATEPAFAQVSGGGQLPTVLQNIFQIFAGPSGAYLAALACLVVWLLAGMHWMSRRDGFITCGCCVGAWVAAWFINTVIGWA